MISIAGARDQLVIGEVEADVEGSPISIWYGRCRQAAVGDIQNDLPPMVLHRRQRESSLADHLRPAMQRRLGWCPLVECQSRPHCLCFEHDLSPSPQTYFV